MNPLLPADFGKNELEFQLPAELEKEIAASVERFIAEWPTALRPILEKQGAVAKYRQEVTTMVRRAFVAGRQYVQGDYFGGDFPPFFFPHEFRETYKPGEAKGLCDFCSLPLTDLIHCPPELRESRPSAETPVRREKDTGQ